MDVQDLKYSAEPTNLEEIIEEPNGDENDEWMTDDDDDITDAESLQMTPTKVILIFK